MSTGAELDPAALVERFTLKALVESCLVLEEGISSVREIDLGMMTGAGIIPGREYANPESHRAWSIWIPD